MAQASYRSKARYAVRRRDGQHWPAVTTTTRLENALAALERIAAEQPGTDLKVSKLVGRDWVDLAERPAA